MDFEWDEAKFADAITIFDAWTLTIVDDRFDYGEVRSISTGPMASSLVTTVVHTDRKNRIRLISARPASAKERIRYETALRSAPDARGTRKPER